MTRGFAIFLLLVASAFADEPRAELPQKSRVVVVQNPAAVRGFDADSAAVRAMVASGIKILTGQQQEAAAWRELASSNDVVGIKINTQAAPLHGTRRAVVEAIAEGLQLAGVAATNIVVWDRDATKMRAAGYKTNVDGPGLRVVSIVQDTGWDELVAFENNVVGKLIWGDLLYGKDDEALSTRSHLPTVLTRSVTKVINVPVLQDHDACGISGSLYNLSLANVDNSRRFEIPGLHGDPVIGELFAMPYVREKLILNVMDALVGGYAAGPAFKPQYSWKYGALIFSRDPVAVDAFALELIEAKRREAKVPAIGADARHIDTARRIGLGRSDRDNIDLIEIRQ